MNILTIDTSQLLSGMILAEDVFTLRNERILPRNTIISPKIILKLKLNGIPKVMVYIPKNLVNSQPAPESAQSSELKNSVEFKKFKKYYMESLECLKQTFFGLLGYSDAPFSPGLLLSSADALLKECRSSLRTFEMLACMRELNDLVYVHSLNVALICSSFGQWLNLSEPDKKDLLIGAMLHDIGKLKIPSEIMNKPTALTKEEYLIIRKHPQLGYDLLKKQSLSSNILDVVLFHHERSDGSGYPAQKKGTEIPPLAKITAIADVYDAMTSERSYRQSFCPFDVIHTFEEEGYAKYDAAYLYPILEHVSLAYMNATVQLSNSLIGEVVMINKMELSRPIVKVEKQFFDLSRLHDLTITKIL